MASSPTRNDVADRQPSRLPKPTDGSDGAKLLAFMAASERWQSQPAGVSATRSFLAHAGERREMWTEKAILDWEDACRERLKPSTVILYVTSVEKALKEFAAELSQQEASSKFEKHLEEASVTVATWPEWKQGLLGAREGSATAPKVQLDLQLRSVVDEAVQDAARKPCYLNSPETQSRLETRPATEFEESLLDELFLEFQHKPFSWTAVYQAAKGNATLETALSDVGLPRDRQQWGYKFNGELKQLQGKTFSSGLAIETNDIYRGFRPMLWKVVKVAKGVKGVKGVKVETVATPSPSASPTALGLRQLIAEGIIGNVLTGVVADRILSSVVDGEEAKVLGNAYAAGLISGQQLDWLLSRLGSRV
jgi:hypothetical protein